MSANFQPCSSNSKIRIRRQLRSLAPRRPLRFCFSVRRAAVVNFKPGNFVLPPLAFFHTLLLIKSYALAQALP